MVCAGARLSSELNSELDRLGIRSRIIEVVSPSSSLLLALYNKASALLFVSLHEGFGWPIIEAQACGCPVITSNRDPMKSIAGDAALTVDPTLPVEAAKSISSRWEWICGQREASIRNAASFSPDFIADQYVAFYQDADIFPAAGKRGSRPQ
jgi:glycosyltransferase involved in cell wall biosynthesis